MEKLELSKDEWRKRLKPEQFHILREEGTESAYSSFLHENKRKGTYIRVKRRLDL